MPELVAGNLLAQLLGKHNAARQAAEDVLDRNGYASVDARTRRASRTKR